MGDPLEGYRLADSRDLLRNVRYIEELAIHGAERESVEVVFKFSIRNVAVVFRACTEVFEHRLVPYFSKNNVDQEESAVLG